MFASALGLARVLAFASVVASVLVACGGATATPPRSGADGKGAKPTAAPGDGDSTDPGLQTTAARIEAAEKRLAECMGTRPACAELWQRQVAVDVERGAKSCQKGIWFVCVLLYEAGQDGVAPLSGQGLPAWRWVTETMALVGGETGPGLVLLPGAQVLLLGVEGTEARIALPSDERFERTVPTQPEYRVELSRLSEQQRFVAPSAPQGQVVWGQRQRLGLVPGGAAFATTSGQPLVIEGVQRDGRGKRYQLVSESLRGVRVTGFAEPSRGQVGDELVDCFVYPSDGTNVPDALPFELTRMTEQKQQLVDAGTRFYVYPGGGRACETRGLIGERAMAVLEVDDRGVLVGRDFRYEVPVGYRRLGARHFWRMAADCEAERQADVKWVKGLDKELARGGAK